MTIHWNGGTLAHAEDLVCFLPIQEVPFPSKPLLQVHTKLPCTSSHVALEWQLSISSSHSLTSENFTRENIECYALMVSGRGKAGYVCA